MPVRVLQQILPVLLTLTLMGGLACAPRSEDTAAVLPAAARDPHSHSRPDEVVVRHMELDLDVDFEMRRLRGRASLDIDNLTGADAIDLDAWDLEILSVHTEPNGLPAEFSLSESQPFLGQRLRIALAPGTEKIHIDYQTSPEAVALQWLEPSQTSGEQPFLYSQSQPNLARTWIPCQDSPGVRMTYEATIRVPKGMMAVMSAANSTVPAADGVHTFVMEQPIPCYLVALAVGELEFRELGPRTGVYAEPAGLDAAAWEFADVEAMMTAAERLYGPYQWDRYDILVLPPSFPFGGMENPRLTFATPTILAGDRSLVSLVAHELAHSWSGNLVTNTTWNDTWLNEGFTTYFESRIMEEIYGRDYSEMLAVLDFQGLQEALTELGPESPDSRLHLDMAGRDPDLASGTVAYVKGALFLRWLEEKVGREELDRLLSAWFEANAFRGQDADGFVHFLDAELHLDSNESLAEAVEAWIFDPGLPADHPVPSSPRLEAVKSQIDVWRDGRDAESLRTADWSTQEWLYFVNNQPDDLEADDLEALDEIFSLTASGNDQILSRWLALSVRHGYQRVDPVVEEFLVRVGRRWLVQSIYEELVATPEGRERAMEIYARARPGYHGILRATVDAVLAGEKSGAP